MNFMLWFLFWFFLAFGVLSFFTLALIGFRYGRTIRKSLPFVRRATQLWMAQNKKGK